ncbi:MAG: hypothetical protein OER90_14705 [Gemmatimonadota bacterium]|nr:hypothetical protein [Gemmatimonadota bacterium]
MAGCYDGPTYCLNAGGWAVEESENAVTLTPADIDAALVISSLTKEDGRISTDELGRMSGHGSPPDAIRTPVDCGQFHGVRAQYGGTEATHWRVWWLAHEQTHLYVTYNCHVDYAGRHDAVVDWMLSTLEHRSSAA